MNVYFTQKYVQMKKKKEKKQEIVAMKTMDKKIIYFGRFIFN